MVFPLKLSPSDQVPRPDVEPRRAKFPPSSDELPLAPEEMPRKPSATRRDPPGGRVQRRNGGFLNLFKVESHKKNLEF